jgi:hypothetical protein
MTADFSAFDADQGHDHHGHGHGKMGACMKEAWAATKPSDDQNKQAGAFCETAKAVIDANKDAAKSAMQGLMTEWMKQPVSRDGVIAAEGTAETAFAPIKGAVRDTKISILNLLTADQRKAFDQEFIECLHK